jgi:hypothetical protein
MAACKQLLLILNSDPLCAIHVLAVRVMITRRHAGCGVQCKVTHGLGYASRGPPDPP